MPLPPPLRKPDVRVKISLLTMILSAIVLTTPITLTTISVYNVEQTIDTYVPARLRAQAADVAAAVAFATQSELMAELTDTVAAVQQTLQRFENERPPTPAASPGTPAAPNTTLLVGQAGLGLQHASLTWLELSVVADGMCPFAGAADDPKAGIRAAEEAYPEAVGTVAHTLDFIRRRLATHVTTSLTSGGAAIELTGGQDQSTLTAPTVLVSLLVNASATSVFDDQRAESAAAADAATPVAKLIADAAANVSDAWAPACAFASGAALVDTPIGGAGIPADLGVNISAGRWPTVQELTAQLNRDAGHHCASWPLVPALERGSERALCQPFTALRLANNAVLDSSVTQPPSSLVPCNVSADDCAAAGTWWDRPPTWAAFNGTYGLGVDPFCAPPLNAAASTLVGSPRAARRHTATKADLGPQANTLTRRLRRAPYVRDVVPTEAIGLFRSASDEAWCFVGDTSDDRGNVLPNRMLPRWSARQRSMQQCVLSEVRQVNRSQMMPPGTPKRGEDPSDVAEVVDVPLWGSINRTDFEMITTLPVTVNRRYALTDAASFEEPRNVALLQATVTYPPIALAELLRRAAAGSSMVAAIVDRRSNAILACVADGDAIGREDEDLRVVSRPSAEGCGVVASLMADVVAGREVPSSDLGVPTVDKLTEEPGEAYAHLLFAERLYESTPPCARTDTEAESAGGFEAMRRASMQGTGNGADDWYVIVALPTRSYLELVLFTRARMVVTAFAVGAVSVILMLLMMRSLMHPLRALTRAIGCCATMQLDKMELMEASSVAEIAEIQKSVAYLAIRLYHYQRFLPDRMVLDTALAGDGDSESSDIESAPMFARAGGSANTKGRGTARKAASQRERDADRFAPKRRKAVSATAQIEMAERQFGEEDDEDDDSSDAGGSTTSGSFDEIDGGEIDLLQDAHDGVGSGDDTASDKARRQQRRKQRRRAAKAAKRELDRSQEEEDAAALEDPLLGRTTDVDAGAAAAGGERDEDEEGAPVHTIQVNAAYETGGNGPAQMQRLRGGAHRPHRNARFSFRYRVTDAVHPMLLRKCRVHLNERPGEVLMLFVHTPDGKRQLTNNEDVLFAIEYFANQGDLAALQVTVMKASVRSMLPAMIALATVLSAGSRLLLSIARMLEPDPRIQIIGVLLVACLGTQVAQNILVTAYLMGRFSGIDSEFREWRKVSRREARFALLVGAFNVTNVEVLASHLRICGEFLRLTAPLNANLAQKIRKYSLMGFLIGDLIPFVIIVIETILRRSYRDPFVLTSLFFSVLSVVSILVRHGIIRFVMDVAVQRNKQSVRNQSTKTMILSRKEVSLLRLGFADEGALIAVLTPKEIDLLSEAVYTAASPVVRKYGGLLISTIGLTFTVVFNAHTVVPAHASAAYAAHRAIDKELAKHVKPFLVRVQRNRHRVKYGAKIKFDRGKASFRHRVIGSIVSGEMCLGYVGTLTSQSFQHVDELHDLSKSLFELNVRYGTSLLVNGAMVVLVRTATIKEPMLTRRVDRVTMRTTVPGMAMRLHEEQRRIDALRARMRQQEAARQHSNGNAVTSPDDYDADEEATMSELAKALAANPLLSGKGTALDTASAVTMIGGPAPDTSGVAEHDVHEVMLEDLKVKHEEELEDLLDDLGDAVLDQYTVVHSIATTAVNRQRRKERIAGLSLSSATVETIKRFDKAMESLLTLRNPTEVLRFARSIQHDQVAQNVSKWARFVNALNETEGVAFPRPVTVLGLQLHPCEVDPRITPAGAREGLDDTFAQQAARRAAVQRHLRPPRSERRMRAAHSSPGGTGQRETAAGSGAVLERVIGSDTFTVDFVPRTHGPVVDL